MKKVSTSANVTAFVQVHSKSRTNASILPRAPRERVLSEDLVATVPELGKIAVLVFIILFIQRRPQGLFALKGRLEA